MRKVVKQVWDYFTGYSDERSLLKQQIVELSKQLSERDQSLNEKKDTIETLSLQMQRQNESIRNLKTKNGLLKARIAIRG